MPSHIRDPLTHPPAPPLCAECGKRKASLRLALYPEKPSLVTSPLCPVCAQALMNIHIGAKEVPL